MNIICRFFIWNVLSIILRTKLNFFKSSHEENRNASNCLPEKGKGDFACSVPHIWHPVRTEFPAQRIMRLKDTLPFQYNCEQSLSSNNQGVMGFKNLNSDTIPRLSVSSTPPSSNIKILTDHFFFVLVKQYVKNRNG